MDPEALPEDVRALVVAQLDDAVEVACQPLNARTIERALQDAWARAPRKVLDELYPEPLAVRAAAQVHRGVLGGVDVAIRVRRPGLERAVRGDIALLDALAGPLRGVLPASDTRALLHAVREQALDELDLEHEASTQRRVARALRGVDGVSVPRIHSELCSESVLVCDLLAGPTLADGARPADAAAAAAALIGAQLSVARRAGLLLLDMRPGHVVVLPEGGLGLLGAGIARPVDRDRVELVVQALRAVREGDPAGFATALGRAGSLSGVSARAAYPAARTALGPLAAGPATLDAAALRGLARRSARVAPHAFDLLGAVTAIPDDLWLARSAGQLVATLARLGASADWALLDAFSAPGEQRTD